MCAYIHRHAFGQISAPVRACGLSEDCRHLLGVLGNGYIFRYEYRNISAAADFKARKDSDVTNEECE